MNPAKQYSRDYDIPLELAERYVATQKRYTALLHIARQTVKGWDLSLRATTNLANSGRAIAQSTINTAAWILADELSTDSDPKEPRPLYVDAVSAHIPPYHHSLHDIYTTYVDFNHVTFLAAYHVERKEGKDHARALHGAAKTVWKVELPLFTFDGTEYTREQLAQRSDLLLYTEDPLREETAPFFLEQRRVNLHDMQTYLAWLAGVSRDYEPEGARTLHTYTRQELACLFSLGDTVDHFRQYWGRDRARLEDETVQRRIAVNTAIHHAPCPEKASEQLDEVIADLEASVQRREARARKTWGKIDVANAFLLGSGPAGNQTHLEKARYKLRVVQDHRMWLREELSRLEQTLLT